MILVFIRALILFLVATIVIRLMGKRQISELQPYEMVITIMIADLAATPMENHGVSLLYGIIPIIALYLAYSLLSFVSLKSELFRKVISGKPTIIISDGNIIYHELKKLDYNLNELLEQLRTKDVYDIRQVQYAILESSGELNVLEKAEFRIPTTKELGLFVPPSFIPDTLILDGKIHNKILAQCNLNIDDFVSLLKSKGFTSIKNILFASIDNNGEIFIQEKNKPSKTIEMKAGAKNVS